MCVLGYNVNKGQEISLRLRTDDWRGFRKYARIRETLIHELAHMVGAQHTQLLPACQKPVQFDRRLLHFQLLVFLFSMFDQHVRESVAVVHCLCH